MNKPCVYLDTNVFIAAYESIGAKSDHAWWILEAAEQGMFRAVTSELTLAELLVRPISEGNVKIREIYEVVISESPEIDVPPVSRAALVASAELRAGRSGLKLPDAIHCVTAIMHNCLGIVTDDARLPKGLDIEVIPFGPRTLDRIRVLVA